MARRLIEKVSQFNDAFANALMAAYGSPITIWVFIVFSAVGAFVSADVLQKMTYWSNAVQLVFCAVSVFTSVLALRTASAVKTKVHEIHSTVHQAV